MKDDLNPELYKFLICKLGLDSLRTPASKLDFFPWFGSSTKPCSCSNKPWWTCKPNVQKPVPSKSCGPISRPDNITLPSSPSNNYFNRRDALKRRDRFAASITPLVLAISGYGSMLHVGYTTVKISSGSDFPFSDNDGITEQNDYSKGDCISHQPGSENSFKDQFDVCFKNNQVCSPSNSASEMGRKSRSSQLPEQDFPASKDIMQLPVTNGLSLVNLTVDVKSNDDDDECWKTFNLSTPEGGGAETAFKEDGKEVVITPDFQTGNNNPSPCKKNIDTMGKTSKLPTEKLARKGQIEIDEKLYASPLQLSPFGGKGIKDEDPADKSFKDILVTPKYIPLERSESDLDELCVEEIKGESLIGKLRRQVDFDRKTILKLYEEIDEERSAAAEAASQAMAMITKLQEEKALIDLDALQCLRVMEEQAEHDSAALEKACDLLAEKEKEVQDLEAELEFYRSKYPDEYQEEQTQFLRQPSDVIGGEDNELEDSETRRMETKEGKSSQKDES